MNITTAGDGLKIPPAFPSLAVDCRSIVPSHLIGSATDDYVKICCPFHNDATPSCVVYAESYYCYACNSSGKAISLYMALYQADRDAAIQQLDSGKYPGFTKVERTLKLPKQTLAMELHHNLTDEAMEYFVYERGLYPETVSQYQLGYGSLYTGSVQGYTIPIYQKNKLRQIKLRIPKETQDKYRSIGGAGSWLFLGEDVQYEEQVFLCGGEFDAMVLRQNGLIATAPTSGEKRFDKSWLRNFEGTTPYCAYDSDEAGEAGYMKLRKLFGGKIKRIHLPVKDITEFFLTYSTDDFTELVRDADIRYALC